MMMDVSDMNLHQEMDLTTAATVLYDNVTSEVANSMTETLVNLNSRFSRTIFPFAVTLAVIAAFGVLGNLLVLLVFTLSKDYRNNNFKIFVIFLAVVDLLSSAIVIPAEAFTEMHFFNFKNLLLCQIKGFFNLFSAISSCVILLIISVDRYRSVCQPFKAPLQSRFVMKVMFVAAFVIPVCLSVPGTYITGISTFNKTNIYGSFTEVKSCIASDQYKNSTFRKVYKIVLGIILVSCSLCYVLLYTFVMKTAVQQLKSIEQQQQNKPRSLNDVGSSLSQSRKSEASRSHSTSSTRSVLVRTFSKLSQHSRETSSRRIPYKTLVWLTIMIIFILTYSANLIQTIRVDRILELSENEFVLYTFVAKLYFINHIVNPFVYFVFVSRFRTSCKQLFRCMKQKKRSTADVYL